MTPSLENNIGTTMFPRPALTFAYGKLSDNVSSAEAAQTFTTLLGNGVCTMEKFGTTACDFHAMKSLPEGVVSVIESLERSGVCISNQTLSNITRCEIQELIPSNLLPRDMRFGSEALVTVIIYSVLFVVAALGNLTVFITLYRNRRFKSRVNIFIMHLAVADLVVTFVMMPLEICWHITVEWLAGDVACRILMFSRVFGLYLSSFVLIIISLDRYCAIIHPLAFNEAKTRGKNMLVMAWSCSFIVSVPQSVIFHVERHPLYTWYEQCVTFNFFPSPNHELAYNLFNLMALYGLPLIVIMTSYSAILFKVITKTKQSKDQMGNREANGMRRSNVGNLEKAKTRTLKLTLIIVLVFIFCWTPYFAMSCWVWFDRESASQVHPMIKKGLYIFAVSNSCMNPIVYGLYATRFKRELRTCCLGLQGRCFGKQPSRNHLSMAYMDSNYSRVYRETTRETISSRTHPAGQGSSSESTLDQLLSRNEKQDADDGLKMNKYSIYSEERR